MLKQFFDLPENSQETWTNKVQERYYQYMQEKGFVSGNAPRKDKDARQKTSGLVDLGLIDRNRRLTEVGQALYEISQNSDFKSDNFLRISKDSFIYLKQILKTSLVVESDTVRPLIVLLYLLSEYDYLTTEEFTFLLPLCTNRENTESIKQKISLLREKQLTIDDIIISVLLSKDNYKKALQVLLDNEVTDDIVCEVGMNRKSRQYDVNYATLYHKLYSVFFEHKIEKTAELLNAIKFVKTGTWWRSYLFNTSTNKAITNNPEKHIRNNVFKECQSVEAFKINFFKLMHLFKAKATLLDYFDLNRRYIKITDIILFEDGEVKLDMVPKHFFKPVITDLYNEAFSSCDLLNKNCSLSDLSSALVYNEKQIMDGLSGELNKSISTMDEAYSIVEGHRYKRLEKLIDDKFSDSNLLTLLEKFDCREDDTISSMVTDNADIPTIFEYILGIVWYKISDRKGKLLDYLKLSLDADLLPVSHAAGGEADIVYQYESTAFYPEHALLLEATLADGTSQRRMEMEPVSRHLGNHLLTNKNVKSYCVFITSRHLNVNVISDFRGRKNLIYCNSKNPDDYIEGMKIIPIETGDLRNIIRQGKKYPELYKRFETAFDSEEMHPKKWYDNFVKIQ